MATTDTIITPDIYRIPYIGVGPPSVDNPIPIAEINHVSFNATVTAAAAGEDQKLVVKCDLPQGYGYVLSHMSMWMYDAEVGDMADWDTSMNSYLTNVGSGSTPGSWISGTRIKSDGLWTRSSTLKGATYLATELPQKVVIPSLGVKGQFYTEMRNLVIDGGPMTFYFLAKFLEFDLNQSYHWAVNTPWPVR